MSSRSRGLPPGPRLPEVVQSLMLWTSIDRFLEGCARRYGPVFTAKIAPMGTLVYVTDPAEIKRIFTGDTSVFHAGEANATVLERIMGRHSVLIVDDEEHLRQRRRMLPPFHGESVRRYSEVIEQVTREEMARWPRATAFALHPRMHAIALEVILRAVIGVEEPARLAQLRSLLPQLGELNIVLLFSWAWPRLNAFGPWRKYERLRHEIDEVLYDEIRRRRAAPDLERREDILSLLIRGSGGEEPMTDEELRDQLITLLLAGHETTATGLAWAFERLLRHPHALARLEHEIAAGEDAYLDAVVKETLRVRPVIFDVARKLKAPAEVAGYTLPAGVTVMPAVGIVQRSRERWAGPREFRPERFLEGQPEPYTWIPFGGGTRRCLGAAFATVEMKTVLRTVLSELELRADRPEPERVRMRHITLVPSRGARAIATVRREPLAAGEAPKTAAAAA
jgi:cytochrome P450 family 135